MLLLTSSSDLVTVVTSAIADIEVHASWADNVTGTITPGRTNTASITSATTTTVVAGPASGQRNVRHLNIRNNHATTCNVTVSHSDGTNVETLMYAVLIANEALVLDQTGMWVHYDAVGSPYPRGGLVAASTAEMEAGTSTSVMVTPANQHRHPASCKFFIQARTDGGFSADTGSSLPTYNCTSITDTGAGRMTVNIGTDFSSANWCCQASIKRTATTLTVTNLKYVTIRNASQAAGTVEVECYDGTATTAVQEDPNSWLVCGYGDQ